MSSSQPFIPSSPLSPAAGNTQRRKSRFTFRHLAQLSLSATSCPLRVIAHVDLDAFYAQCEMVRLSVPEDKPLAVQQWQGLIAINYPARKSGLNRHITTTEARKLCPELIMQHVATWKEGDAMWAYHDDAFKQMATHKVSLDPYRLESRKILALMKEVLPEPPIQKVEKAGIDEVFLDLSAQIHSVLIERYPELSGPPPYDDPSENLPPPPTTALDWNTDALVDLDSTETEDDDPDWDDIAMLIGSEIVRSVRAAIRSKLKYTCSAGVAHNKMLAKLGSAHRKPNQQTIVRNRAIQQFLGDFKFTKIRNLGGKLGDQVVETFGTDSVRELLSTSIEQMKSKLGDDTGSWVYHVIRGDDFSEVNSRTQIKSMLSAKSFRPSINTPEQAVRWLRIFVADIFSRLVEEGVLENKRRPKTMNLHHRQGGQMRSRQAPIPQGRRMDEDMLFDLAQNLLGQVIVEGKAWPCACLQLSVGGFEDGVTNNRGIGSFLVTGKEAKALKPTMRDSGTDHAPLAEAVRPEKRRKLDTDGIQKFFVKKQGSRDEHGADFGIHDDFADAVTTQVPSIEDSVDPKDSSGCQSPIIGGHTSNLGGQSSDPTSTETQAQHNHHNPRCTSIPHVHQSSITTYTCDRCKKIMQMAEKEEHQDWHFARDLQTQERASSSAAELSARRPSGSTQSAVESRGSSLLAKKHIVNAPNNSSGLKRVDKGQSKLAFGR
ncbi:MAG: DNA-directed DNA polymerase eta rad30 [Candelina mexicana]|nr:MAG: DNA-directed DNA polymerase eta rad30 [Candelina mexicana]